METKVDNVALMTAEMGYDITIICTSDAHQAAFWIDKLESAKGTIVPAASTVVAVDEDWTGGGAGNFLGTLYAWSKACALLAEQGRDLKAELDGGASVALFHTAGKGTRLAPLPGGENNNKPGVKLPVPGASSILECVIRQTGAYAKSRGGRLSVFWGDQIFVPSIAATYTPRHHADILCALGPMPDAEEWQSRGLQSYGLIASDKEGSVLAQLEKVSHADATQRLSKFESVDRVGMSLGSFSLSATFLATLMSGFSVELSSKTGKMDSDPHLWMALTLDPDAYAAMMVQKGEFAEAAAREHHARVASIIEGLDMSAAGLFGAVDVGMQFSIWDYGQLKFYRTNALLLTDDSEDACLARNFFGIKEEARITPDSQLGACEIDAASVVSSTQCASGRITASTICGCSASEIQADGAVLVNVCSKKIVAPRGSVAYNLVDNSDEGIVLGEDEVRVGVFTLDAESNYFEMRSNVATTDSGKVFKEKVHSNSKSFQEVYDMNCGVNVSACVEVSRAAREGFAAAL